MKKADKILLYSAVLYITFPIIIFLLGWTKLLIAIPAILCVLFLSYQLVNDLAADADISITENKRFWIVSLLVIAIWVLFSGIGNFSYQTGDYIIRNPMFRDLRRYSWPVIYNMSAESSLVREFTGSSKNALYVYYFTWWLPASLFAKILFFVGTRIVNVDAYANIALYLWAVIGLFLIFYLLVKYLKRYSYWILSSLVLFGGFDFLVYLLMHMHLPINEHIEWWAGGICTYFQYSANTTQLYWVFNQSIPVWVIVVILLNMKESKHKLGWASLCIAYSPYATIGIIPLAIYSVLKKNGKTLAKRMRDCVSIVNIVVPIFMALVYVSFFYLKFGAGTSSSGFMFSIYPEFRTFTLYVTFIIVEFLVYFMCMGQDGHKYEFYWVVLAELLAFPLFRSGMNNDFTMRASIPALFILMVFCLRYLFDMESAGNIKKRKIMMLCLSIGYLVSFTEIQRNVTMTMTIPQQDYINEDVYSFGTMYTDNENQIKVNLSQYMALDNDYEDSFFYNNIMKRK